MKKYFFKLFIIFLLISIGVQGQGPGPCNGGDYPPICNERCDDCPSEEFDCQQCLAENPDASVPIDGGLSWLLLAGVGLAGNHIRKKRKGKKINE